MKIPQFHRIIPSKYLQETCKCDFEFLKELGQKAGFEV